LFDSNFTKRKRKKEKKKEPQLYVSRRISRRFEACHERRVVNNTADGRPTMWIQLTFFFSVCVQHVYYAGRTGGVVDGTIVRRRRPPFPVCDFQIDDKKANERTTLIYSGEPASSQDILSLNFDTK
jgi:hypothetical protein